MQRYIHAKEKEMSSEVCARLFERQTLQVQEAPQEPEAVKWLRSARWSVERAISTGSAAPKASRSTLRDVAGRLGEPMKVKRHCGKSHNRTKRCKHGFRMGSCKCKKPRRR